MPVDNASWKNEGAKCCNFQLDYQVKKTVDQQKIVTWANSITREEGRETRSTIHQIGDWWFPTGDEWMNLPGNNLASWKIFFPVGGLLKPLSTKLFPGETAIIAKLPFGHVPAKDSS